MPGALPTGSGFTNLSNIIQANQNNQLGNTIQSGVQKNISGLQYNVNQAQQQFNTQANAANQNTAANQQLVQNTIGNIVNQGTQANANAPQAQGAPTSGGPVVNNEATGTTQFPAMQNVMASAATPSTTTPSTSQLQAGSPTSATPATPTNAPTPATPAATNAVPGSFGFTSPYASNTTSGTNTTAAAPVPTGAANFSQFLQGGYTGPTQLNNLSALQAQGQNLQSLGQNLGTQGGLQSLLQQYAGAPGYNQGEQTLDTILLGQTAKPQLQNIAQSLQNAANIPNQAEAQVAGLAQQTALGNQAFAQNVQNQLAAAQSPILGNIQNNITGLNQQNANTQAVGQQIYNLLNNPLPSTAPGPGTSKLPNMIGGGQATPTTESEAASSALQLASQNGLIDPSTLTYIQNSLKTAPASGPGDAQQLLSQAFNFNPATPTYTLQQGANAQQAAQLNALEQLSGNAPQFGTYGAAAYAPGFNVNNLPVPPPPPPPAAPAPAFIPGKAVW